MNPERLLQNFDRLIDTPDAVLRLRRFILDLAVRGKLVEQNPEDEPAAELLRRIEAEKKQSFSSSDKKTQPLDEAQIPFAIPDNWHWVTLSKVTKRIHYGYTASADHNKSAVRLLRITDIQGNRVDWNSVPGCDIADSTVTQYELAPRDILIARTGGTIGKTFLVEDVPVKAVFASYLIRVIPSDGVSEYFLKRYMESPLYWNQLYEESKGTGQPNVNGKALGNLSIPIPPLTEQHRIVAKVDELMKLCDELEETQAKREKRRDRLVAATLHGLNNGSPDSEAREVLPFKDSTRFYFNHLSSLTTRPEHIQQLRQTILNLAVRGKLVPQDSKDVPASELLKRIQKEKAGLTTQDKIKKEVLVPITDNKNPFSVPENWVWCRLPQILDAGDSLRRGPFGSSITKAMFVPKSDSSTKVYEQKNAIYKDYSIGSYYIDLSEHPNLKGFIAGPGDLIISCAGTIGETYLLPNDAPKGIINQALLKLRLYKSAVVDRYFMMVFKANTKSRIEEDAKGTAMKNIGSVDYLKHKLLFPLPPFTEQKRILAKVDELMALCDEMESQITTDTTTSRKLLEATLQDVLLPLK